MLAAAGLYALEHHVQRLAEDHENAQHLAAGLRAIGSGGRRTSDQYGFCRYRPENHVAALATQLAEHGILAMHHAAYPFGDPSGPAARKIDAALQAFRDYPHWSRDS